MKVSRAQVEENRQRILDNAAQLFRERGFDGIGLNDLMQAAGLTRGGFYGHFASKDDLAAQALAQALASNREQWRAQPDRSLATWIRGYLSDTHRDEVGQGCGLAALAADVARAGPAVREVFTRGVQGLAQTLTPQMPGGDEGERRAQALALLASLVGAVVLARAVDDESLSRELRVAVQAHLPVDVG